MPITLVLSVMESTSPPAKRINDSITWDQIKACRGMLGYIERYVKKTRSRKASMIEEGIWSNCQGGLIPKRGRKITRNMNSDSVTWITRQALRKIARDTVSNRQ